MKTTWAQVASRHRPAWDGASAVLNPSLGLLPRRLVTPRIIVSYINIVCFICHRDEEEDEDEDVGTSWSALMIPQ